MTSRSNAPRIVHLSHTAWVTAVPLSRSPLLCPSSSLFRWPRRMRSRPTVPLAASHTV